MKPNSESSECPLCDARELHLAYRGRIRAGKPGDLTAGDHAVWKCGRCGVGFLENAHSIDYESDAYRNIVDGDGSVDQFYRLHDREQLPKLSAVGIEHLRGAVVLDVGSGGGSFLDAVKGFSEATLAVEPARGYHSALAAKGHVVYPYCADVDARWLGRVGLATCFSVIEHVDDPAALLRDIRRCLLPDGELILSTPNSQDWLLDLIPTDYGAFFYRVVHKWYFDEKSLTYLAREVGYRKCEISYAHRFDLSNAMVWLRDRQPSGCGKLDLPLPLNAAFRAWLEGAGKADYMYARLRN